jgi:hypothetical protein
LPTTFADTPSRQRGLIALHQMQVNAFNVLALAAIGAAERLWSLHLSAGRLMIDQGARAAGCLLSRGALEAGSDAGAAADAPAPPPAAAPAASKAADAAAPMSEGRSPRAASSESPKPRTRRAAKPVQGTIRNKRKAV